MSLPAGWCRTSVTATLTLSFTLEMKAQTTVGGARVDHLEFSTQPDPLATPHGRSDLWVGTGNAAESWTLVEVAMRNYQTGSFGVLSGTSGAGAATGEPAWLPAITIEKEWTGLTLGVTIQEGTLIWAWFAEAASSLIHRVNGATVTTTAGPGTPNRTGDGWQFNFGFGVGTPYNGQGPILSFERNVYYNHLTPGISGSTFYDHVRFTAFVGEGVSLTPPYTTTFKATTSTGAEPLRLLEHSWGGPYRCTLDLAVDETSGAAVLADFTHTEAGSGTTPDTVGAQRDFFDGSGFDSLSGGHEVPAAVLADPWLSAQTVRPYDADLAFRFEGNSPLAPDAVTPTDWSVGDLEITSPVNVLNSATAWTSDLGAVVITGTPTVPIFTVSAEPCRVIRPLAESWRDWIDSGDPDFEADDGGVTTKHDYYASGASDDAWGWGLYSYLDIDMTVPAGDDTQIAVTITWALLKGSSGTTVDTIERTYSTDVASNPITFPAGGRSTQRIDLMFPVEIDGRPFYGERVDEIRILGLKVGATTLHDITLVTDEDAYLTLSGRKETLRDGTVVYTGAVLTQDGAAPGLLWGRDAPVSPLSGDLDLDGWQDHRGDHQNGAFLLNGVTKEFPGKAPGMQSLTVEETFTELHRMEGLTATYDDTAFRAALTDGDGNEAGLDENDVAVPFADAIPADCFVPTLPADRIASNTPYDVRGQLVVTGVVIPAGVDPSDLVIFQRNHLGAVLEGLATDASYNRHGAGVTVTAKGYTGGAPAAGDTAVGAPVTTDASGFALVPIRTGTLGGSQFSATLS